jgi:hypothetical protein|tara:strand:- start:5187 stop:5354 length:168 start_codon:yes stop_codon:yes gene_type:complete
MSIPDKATYILYGIAYIALGIWALNIFLKTFGSSKNFPKTNSKERKDSSHDNRAN